MYLEGGIYMECDSLVNERAERTKWFLESRFGMFIHWGIYSIPARGEWLRSWEKMTKEEYQKYFDEFNPEKYDPKQWAKTARKAGMKYAVLTAKHHDGFCLFDSKLTDYKSTNTKAGKDLVREYVEAFRSEGLKVGLYYSIIDWHHDGYPAYEDRFHPMRGNEEFKERKLEFSNYIEYMHGQIKELVTEYGKLDIMWFDFSYDNMSGETWKAEELIKMIRSYQPHIVIDNRLEATGGGSSSIKDKCPKIYAGDFASPENVIPPEGVTGEDGNPIPWEACITMNEGWGYNQLDKSYKSARLIIRKIVECVSKGGNLLLNIGPKPNGEIPEKEISLLDEIGRWMEKNSNSIYGCSKSDYEKPEWGRYTQKGNMLYAHIFEENIGPINIKGMAGKIKKARLLEDNTEILIMQPWNVTEYNNDAFINFGNPGHGSFPLPDLIDTVVEFELIEK